MTSPSSSNFWRKTRFVKKNQPNKQKKTFTHSNCVHFQSLSLWVRLEFYFAFKCCPGPGAGNLRLFCASAVAPFSIEKKNKKHQLPNYMETHNAISKNICMYTETLESPYGQALCGVVFLLPEGGRRRPGACCVYRSSSSQTKHPRTRQRTHATDGVDRRQSCASSLLAYYVRRLCRMHRVFCMDDIPMYSPPRAA